MTSFGTVHHKDLGPDGKPRRRYELGDGPEGKAGIKVVGGLLLANAILMIKNVFFGSAKADAPEEPAPVRETQDGALLVDDEAGFVPHLKLVHSREPKDDDGPSAVTHKLKTNGWFDRSSDNFDGESQAKSAPIVVAQQFGSPRSDVSNTLNPFSEIGISNLSSLAGNIAPNTGAGSGSGQRRQAREEDEEENWREELDEAKGPQRSGDTSTGDGEANDAPPLGNRAPQVTGPVRLQNLYVNQIVLIGLTDLLLGATDADGDQLSVENLTVSAGTLTPLTGNSWVFAPELYEPGTITFTYDITDGKDGISQVALLDIHALPGRDIEATAGDDTIIGTPGRDRIDAGPGNDTILAREDVDIVVAGSGDDRVVSGQGDDVIYGGEGDDVIVAGDGNDFVRGGSGDDVILGGKGNDTLFGDDGDDTIYGNEGDDHIFGGLGDDTIEGNAGNDLLFGDEGSDSIYGGDGNDIIVADSGDDETELAIASAPGANEDATSQPAGGQAAPSAATPSPTPEPSQSEDGNELSTEAGTSSPSTDVPAPATEPTTTAAAAQDDSSDGTVDDSGVGAGTQASPPTETSNPPPPQTEQATAALAQEHAAPQAHYDDFVSGGAGDDQINAGSGDDIVYGDAGNDDIEAGSGDDSIYGGSGDDTAEGGSGDDTFFAEVADGNDVYDGGSGSDTYDISNTGADAVIDLVNGSAYGDDIGQDQLEKIEHAVGGDGDDTFIVAGADNILTGGNGNDVFVFVEPTKGGKGGHLKNTITDFEVGDKIDLSQMDGNSGEEGWQRLTFRYDQAEFDGVGQAIYHYADTEAGTVTILRLNIDDDGGGDEVDFEIEILGRHELNDQNVVT